MGYYDFTSNFSIQIDSKLVLDTPNNMELGERIRLLMQKELQKHVQNEQIRKRPQGE